MRPPRPLNSELPLTSQDIIQARQDFLAEDKNKLGEFLAKCRPFILAICVKRIKNIPSLHYTDAEDIAQIVELNLLEKFAYNPERQPHLSDEDRVHEFKGWLSTIVTHKFTDLLRYNDRRPTIVMERGMKIYERQTTDPAITTEIKEEREIFNKAMKKFRDRNPERADALEAHFLGISPRELAPILGYTPTQLSAQFFNDKSWLQRNILRQMERDDDNGRS